MNRRTFFTYALAAPVIAMPLSGALNASGSESYVLEEAAETAASLLVMTEEEQSALVPDARRALAEALLYALKYDKETSWLAADVLIDYALLPQLIVKLEGMLQTRAHTLGIL
jgi:hypothetical protein